MSSRPETSEIQSVVLGIEIEGGTSAAMGAPRNDDGDPVPELLGRSQVLRDIKERIRAAARVSSPVLIHGPSGTGKELVARAIHRASPRNQRAFVAVNCAALPGDLVESELFGSARGAFTGAVAGKVGLFQAAHGGSLFLDEVSEMAPVAQAKLLRALQEHAIRPVGEVREHSVDVRILAATNRPLAVALDDGHLRSDLYYRLAAVTIEIAPLCARPEDVEPIARSLLERWRQERGHGPLGLSGPAMDRLCAYHWPGNVRELQNVLESASLVTGSRPEIGVDDLPATLRPARAPPQDPTLPSCLQSPTPVKLRDGEICLIRRTLALCEGNKARAARFLGISRPLLYKRIKKLGIQP